MTRTRLSVFLSVSVGLLLAAPTASFAQKKKKKAKPVCGVSFLPMAEGAEWTYDFTVPDDPPELPAGQLRLDHPEKLTIKVTKVEKQGDAIQIHLEESYRKVVTNTVLSCDKETLQVDPSSFFANGEPGGGLGMTIENFKRADNPSYIHKKGKLKKDSWREDVSFEVTRTAEEGSSATHPKAKVEVERAVSVVGRDGVNSAMGDHPKATKVEVVITGRASVEGKSVDMPQAKATLWFDNNIGIVRAENRFGQGWVLSGFTWPEQ